MIAQALFLKKSTGKVGQRNYGKFFCYGLPQWLLMLLGELAD
jgi:hypothetical protein